MWAMRGSALAMENIAIHSVDDKCKLHAPHNNETIVSAKPDTGYLHDISETSAKYAIILQLGIAIPTNRSNRS
jgi:hypothetical protein